MKVQELKAMLAEFDPDADVEIQEPNMGSLGIEKVKLMLATTTTIKPGGVIELTEADIAAARPVCTIVTRRLTHGA